MYYTRGFGFIEMSCYFPLLFKGGKPLGNHRLVKEEGKIKLSTTLNIIKIEENNW